MISAQEAERIIRLVATHVRRTVTDQAPIVSAELPETGERFEGIVIPPVSEAPCFSIRKPAQLIHRLDDYVAKGILSNVRAALSQKCAIAERKNIVIAGGTSSGKTTLANALLAEIANQGDRVVILEDTRELQCAAPDSVALRTKPDVATLADLVRSTMRLRPDRIVVGEVRGPEALDMLKAWNTGHPGGLTTVHANSASAALTRIEHSDPGSRRSAHTARTDRRGHRHHRLHHWARQGTRYVENILPAWMAFVMTAAIVSYPSGCPRCPNALRRITAMRHKRIHLLHCCSVHRSGVHCAPAYAAGAGLPWEAPLESILQSIEGPVAKVIAVIVIIMTGLTLAFGDMGGGFRRLIQVVFGLSIAFAATSFFLSFFSFAGGAVIG